MQLLFALGLATASISITLTKTPMFTWVRKLSKNYWWTNLWQCPYCMSHWIAMMFVAIYRPMIFGAWFIDLYTSVFVIVTIAACFITVLNLGGLIASTLKRQFGAQN